MEYQKDSISIKQEQAHMKNKKKEIKRQVRNLYNTLNKIQHTCKTILKAKLYNSL